jgi:hypothetical protein
MEMKRLSIVLGLVGLMLSGAAFADETAFCKTECDSARAQCKANTSKASGDDAVKLLSSEETNAFARTARDPVAGVGAQSLERSGQQNRRAQQMGICDDKYQRCTRACGTSGDGGAVFPVRKRGNTG